MSYNIGKLIQFPKNAHLRIFNKVFKGKAHLILLTPNTPNPQYSYLRNISSSVTY